MAAGVGDAGAQEPLTVRGFLQGTVGYVRRNWPVVLLSVVVSGAVGWLTNVLVMADRYDGFRVPSGGLATGQGNMVQGSLFWLLVSMLLSATITYAVVVGPDRFIAELTGIPQALREATARDGRDAAAHVLVGMAGTLLVVLLMGPALAGALAAATLLVLSPVLRPLVTGALTGAYDAVARRVAPGGHHDVSDAGMAVGLLGTMLGFLVGMLVTGALARIALALLAGVGALLLVRRNRDGTDPDPDGPDGGLAALAVLGGTIALWLLDAGTALADDGGFSECGHPGVIGYLFDCGGSFEVFVRGTFGGAATAAGAGIGSALGGGIGTATAPDVGPGGDDAGRGDDVLDAIGGGPSDAAAASGDVAGGSSDAGGGSGDAGGGSGDAAGGTGDAAGSAGDVSRDPNDILDAIGGGTGDGAPAVDDTATGESGEASGDDGGQDGGTGSGSARRPDEEDT